MMSVSYLNLKWHHMGLVLVIFLFRPTKSEICLPPQSQNYDDDPSVTDEFSCSTKCSLEDHCYAIYYHNGKCITLHSFNIGSATFSDQDFRKHLRIKSSLNGGRINVTRSGWGNKNSSHSFI